MTGKPKRALAHKTTITATRRRADRDAHYDAKVLRKVRDEGPHAPVRNVKQWLRAERLAERGLLTRGETETVRQLASGDLSVRFTPNFTITPKGVAALAAFDAPENPS